VGILLRIGEKDVAVLEAVSDFGVILCNWKDFLEKNYCQSYKKVVYRELLYNRDMPFVTKTHEFVCGVMGKPYKFNHSKRILSLSLMQLSPMDYPSFFSSELAAAYYKFLGLLSPTFSASLALPSNFFLLLSSMGY
jgi:hypothetical protein